MNLFKIVEGLVKLVLSGILLTAALYGAYALWDNEQMNSTAETQMAEVLRWKPQTQENPDSRPSFAQLQAINRDVVGWITLEGTKVDFPVVQGENNHTYLNKDIRGQFSLAGSIFLDSRNAPSFGDAYNLLYGHHMAEGNMFGSLDSYKDPDFFAAHTRGQLLTPDGVYHLEVCGVLLVKASDLSVFTPGPTVPGDLEEKALLLREGLGEGQILALSTCSTEFPDARTVVLTRMERG